MLQTKDSLERHTGLMLTALESEVESLKGAGMRAERELLLSHQKHQDQQHQMDQMARQLAEERQRGEGSGRRSLLRGQALLQTLAEAVRATSLVDHTSAELHNADALLGRMVVVREVREERVVEEELAVVCQTTANTLLAKVRSLAWERQVAEDELAASKAAALRAATSMEEHSAATKQVRMSFPHYDSFEKYLQDIPYSMLVRDCDGPMINVLLWGGLRFTNQVLPNFCFLISCPHSLISSFPFQLAHTLAMEIAAAKAGEMQSTQAAHHLRTMVQRDHVNLEAEKETVRRQV